MTKAEWRRTDGGQRVAHLVAAERSAVVLIELHVNDLRTRGDKCAARCSQLLCTETTDCVKYEQSAVQQQTHTFQCEKSFQSSKNSAIPIFPFELNCTPSPADWPSDSEYATYEKAARGHK